MNNFEKDEKAKQYEDTMTPYALARRIIELEESHNKIKAEAEAVREAANSICYFRGAYMNTATHEELIEHANKLERGEL
jgi:hypothetical protein